MWEQFGCRVWIQGCEINIVPIFVLTNQCNQKFIASVIYTIFTIHREKQMLQRFCKKNESKTNYNQKLQQIRDQN